MSNQSKHMNVSSWRRNALQRKRKLLLLYVQINNAMVVDLARHYINSFDGRRERRWCVRPVNLNRDKHGAFNLYLSAIRDNDPELHKDFLRMTKESFDHLLSLIEHKLTRGYTTKHPVTPGMQLAVTLRYLTTTCSMADLKHSFMLGRTTVSQVIYRTCAAIWEVMSPLYVKFPSTTEEWINISDQYFNNWNFPLCLGAIDGKHVRIQAPLLSGSQFFNHKGFHSIVLLACCDARYKFTYVDVGGYGRSSDAGLFNRSTFGQRLNNNQLNIPGPTTLPNSEVTCNYAFIADEGFPLKPQIMRPYSGKTRDGLTHCKRIFNYRLSRARRIIENSFGILSARFRIFRTEMTCTPNNAEILTKAAICLHNYLLTDESSAYTPAGFVDYEDETGVVQQGQWRQIVQGDNGLVRARMGGNAHPIAATDMRDLLAEYFISDSGKLSFQDNMI